MAYTNTFDTPLFVSSAPQKFGRGWTSQKLEAVISYLTAYRKVMLKQPFHLVYVDAFAGSGLILQRSNERSGEFLFPELSDEGAERFIEGSAVRALQVEPPFNEYVFVEKNREYAKRLGKEIASFPDRENLTRIVRGDANQNLLDFCGKRNWRSSRAVLFLDPYGMQVEWDTLKAIASTKAIDVWYLFPLFAVNRLLKKDGTILDGHRQLLTRIFGTSGWEESFYRPAAQADMFEESSVRNKSANFDSIEEFFLSRLRQIFPSVAPKAGRLYNSKDSALFSLCFAASNAGRGGKIAVRIANTLINKI